MQKKHLTNTNVHHDRSSHQTKNRGELPQLDQEYLQNNRLPGWLSPVEHVTFDLEYMSSSPRLGIELMEGSKEGRQVGRQAGRQAGKRKRGGKERKKENKERRKTQKTFS